MNPWIKRPLQALLGVSLVVGGLTACSSQHHHRGPMTAEKAAEMRERMVDRVSSKLDLDAAQKAKLNTLADRLHAQRTAVVGTAADPRAQVQALVSGDKFDRVRAQALVDEKTRALQQGSPETIAALADFYDSLNPAQQQKVRDFMQRRRGGWMARG